MMMMMISLRLRPAVVCLVVFNLVNTSDKLLLTAALMLVSSHDTSQLWLTLTFIVTSAGNSSHLLWQQF